MAVFSSTVFPLPAAPRIILVSPSRTSKDISSSARTPSPNTTPTFSNRRMLFPSAAGMVSGISSRLADEELAYKKIQYEDGNRRRDHRLGGGASHTLRATRGAEPVKATDQ